MRVASDSHQSLVRSAELCFHQLGVTMEKSEPKLANTTGGASKGKATAMTATCVHAGMGTSLGIVKHPSRKLIAHAG